MTRAETDIQSQCFNEGQKINAYITAGDNIMGTLVGDDDPATAIIYTAAKADENYINKLSPDKQPYFPTGDVPVRIYAFYPQTVTRDVTDFTVAYDQQDNAQYMTSDLMFAKATDQTKQTGDVNLRFSHKMTKLIVTATGQGKVTINSITIKNVARKVGFNTEDGSLGELGDYGDINISNGGAALFPPQSVNPGENGSFIEVSATNAEGQTGTAVFSITPKDFKEGMQYTLNLAIGPQNLISPLTINWTSNSGTLSVAAAGSTGMVIVGMLKTGTDADGNDVTAIPDYVYNGYDRCPSTKNDTIKVVYGDDTLTEGTDYQLVYFENLHAVKDSESPKATVAALGIGKYQGAAAVKTFRIKQAEGQLEYTHHEEGYEVRFVKDGILNNPLKKLGGNDTVNIYGNFTYTANPATGIVYFDEDQNIRMQNGGTVTVTASMDDSGDFTAATASFTVFIKRSNFSNVVGDGDEDGLHVVFDHSNKEYEYNGGMITPTITVYDGETPLSEGANRDYTLTWVTSGRTNVGDYQVTITGQGSYEGSMTTTFKIIKATPVFTLDKSTATITFSDDPDDDSSNGKVTRTATATIGGAAYTGTINYKSSNTDIATVTGAGVVAPTPVKKTWNASPYPPTAGTNTTRSWTKNTNEGGEVTITVYINNTTNINYAEAAYKVNVVKIGWLFEFNGVEGWSATWGGSSYNGTPVHNYNSGGSYQTWKCKTAGKYKLEVWGARGGNFEGTNSSLWGQGGYSVGERTFSVTNNAADLYIVVGSFGKRCMLQGEALTNSGGFNGGGSGGSASNVLPGSGGGGATHIADYLISNGTLSNYSSTTNQNYVLLVAGGGGGAGSRNGDGGDGGGDSGANGKFNGTEQSACAGGTQTTGYSFGVGGNGAAGSGWSGRGNGGGGGGWYGGKASSTSVSDANSYGAGGGSGHINTSKMSNASTQGGIWSDNGKAKITFIGTIPNASARRKE